MELFDQVRHFAHEFALFHNRSALCVAVSGGPDSMVLCHLLRRLAVTENLTLTAAHLDHGLRPESAAEAQWVAKQMADWGVSLITEKASINPAGQGLEAAARTARYDFLRRAAAQVQAEAVALGHTADDQAETFLLRLLRGAGTPGLAAMRPVRTETLVTGRRLRFIRPLLNIRRAEILAYAAEHDVPFLQDPSNQDPGLTRNRLRLEVLPLLADKFNPNLVDTLTRTAGLLAADEDFLSGLARDAFSGLSRHEDGGLILPRGGFEALAPALSSRVVRLAYGHFRGDLRRLTQRHVADVLALIDRGGHGLISLPGGVVFEADRGELTFWPSVPKVEPVRLDIAAPGTYFVDKKGRLTVRTADREVGLPAAPDEAWLDAGLAGWPLSVRSRQPGDVFQPLGAPGRRKVKDWLIDHQVPHRVRRRTLIVSDAQGRVMWLIGLAVDHRFRITEATRRVLRLQYRAV
jgi:tRNA(Ile)-lysidine synthase